ncbi:hypothetical protein TrRE_jg9697 [Triparma retinervis]|uniref:Uncharacterized protein n=1 Tax=Triparma retinervis TaxID=2557542 RepID=A0A9W7CG14_9STRA|nr:hypothetical protein TrRE_jg9697 [Triparma retinervis]
MLNPPPVMQTLLPVASDRLKRGLKSRAKDEVKLRALGVRANKAVKEQDRLKMAEVAQEMSAIAYGKGTTAQIRQESLEKFGCVEWTPEIVGLIKGLAEGKGVVEVGAGNGQWSRKLWDMGVDVLAFDNMTGVPLNRNLYHGGTKPNKDHFFHAVRRGDSRIFEKENVGKVGVGRVLLIVFPDRSRWAKETVEMWVKQSPLNRVLVYVGEGRNGANGCEGLFDLLEGGGWRVLRVEDVGGKGGKGYEKAFFMERVDKGEGGCCGGEKEECEKKCGCE